MKRVLAWILCIILVLSLVLTGVFVADAATLDTNGPLYAGYAKVRIDPTGHPEGAIIGLPMSGYSTSTDRLSTGPMDDTGDGKTDSKDGLFATCIAITDQYGKTIIYYGIDIINPTSAWSNPARTAILAKLEEAGYTLAPGDVYISASHTHNGPDLTYGISFSEDKLAGDKIAQKTKKYRDWVFEMLGQAAVDAMKDREEVTLTKGSVDASDAIKAMNPKATINQQRLGYVRHYKTVVSGKAQYGGSNFGYTKYNDDTSMVMEPVDRMELVQLTPKSGTKDPIVMVNWAAHVTINSTTSTSYGNKNHYKVSSDWVNSMRYDMEDDGYRVAFVQGAAGNRTPTTPVEALKNPDMLVSGEPRGYKYGPLVAKVALYGLKNCMGKPLDTSRIRSATARFDFHTNAPTPEEADLVTAMLAADPSTYPSGYADLIAYLGHADTWPKRTEYYAAFPYLKNINSRYQLSNIKSRMKYLTTEESSITVGVLRIGEELSFVVSPNELADRYSLTDTLAKVTDNDWDDLIDETYGRPLVMGYTNDGAGYIPHQLAYIYNEGSTAYAIGSYESQVARYGRFTGEQLIPFFDSLLDIVNTDEARYQCVCGGKAAGKEGHTCKSVEFLPWTRDDILPTGGNYYLTKDVTTTYQTDISSSTLCLDMNGYDITFKVPQAQGAKAEAGETHYTRVLCVNAGSSLYLTDSTSNPGTLSRDLSELTDTQKKKITNYGLLVSIYGTGEMTMFGGILDATGTVTGGGGCLCVYNQTSEFTMYGGMMKGTQSSNGGVAYNRGSMYLYGGEMTGGTTSGNSGTPGIYNTYESGATVRGNVTIGGTARVWDNTWADGTQNNISLPSKPEENIIVKGNFTGKVGIYTSSPTDGKVIGKADNATIAPGSLMMDRYPDYRVEIKDGQLVLNSQVERCECGGTLAGKTAYGHTCKDITWSAWRNTSSLPTEGNYYLVSDVTVTSQQNVSKNLRLDLNGHTITHKVSSSKTASSRVFYITTGGSLVITDSSENPGSIKRNLVNLTAAQRDAIDNYGLMVLVSEGANIGSFTLYNGILDAEGAKACGGVVSNLNTKGAAVNVYGGTITGANTNALSKQGCYGGGIFSHGPVNIHGGTITGNQAIGGGIMLTKNTSSLLLTGNPIISGNTLPDGKTASNLRTDSTVTVEGTFTGTVGFAVEKPADGVKVADSKNANISAATLTVDGNPNYAVALSGNALVLKTANNKATIVDGGREQHYETLAKAVAAYPGGEAVIKLLSDNAETVAFPANTNLDLNSFDLTGKVTQKGTLFVKDSATDDYTTNDAQGCGILPKSLTDVKGMPGYLMETKANGYSFHCLNLDTVAVNLRPSDMGLYFQSQFGGDEYVKSIVKSYGVALGAGKKPTFTEGTYSVYEGATWTVGADKDGNANNLGKGTLLKDILKPDNTKEDNTTYATTEIYGQAYVEFEDGTRYVGNMVCLTLQEVLMGNDEMLGADGLWENLTENQQKALVDMYTTYYDVMSPSAWKLPNIKAAYQEVKS